MKIYPKLSQLEKLDHPRSWLLRVLYNLFVDTTRRRDRTNVTSLNEMENPDESVVMTSAEPGPEEYAEAAIVETVMEQAWQRMQREQRALLALHDVEGYTLAEMQEITGTNIGTLKSKLHRARVRLGKLLQRETDPVALIARKEG